MTLNNVNVATTRQRSRLTRRASHNQVVLERVLGITTSNSSGLACDPNSGVLAYPAGCVIVILHPNKNKQTHIFNTSRKTFTCLAFSQDGKYLVTGECGHMPCVRVWDRAEKTQVAEVQCHKHGVACVAVSTNSSYIVSVGYQHDMTVSVWEWRKGTVIACNKVSSRVLSVCFSEDNSYFVTAGKRHVKFWYLDTSKERRINSTVPLMGRSGILGEQRNSMFCGLACGQGSMACNTYCITSSGLLCQFNSQRMLDAWVDLKTTSARCLSVSETFIFCGCAGGTVRVFSPQNLQYLTTLHRPHCLGVDVTQGLHPGHLFMAKPEAEYPDTCALTFDPTASKLTCVYSDHSVYVWDVRDIKNVGKVYSALYHSGSVWSVETYPEVADPSLACLPASSFLTCSSDNTIRLWHSDLVHSQTHGQVVDPSYPRNLYSNDLLKIVYVGDDTQHLQPEGERGEGGSMDGKSGIRVLGISPDGQHLAAGDRSGNLLIFGLQFMDELLNIEAHDSEILCLEFSPIETGLNLLASASRDRLIHIFNMERNYSLEQTVYDHSASITAIKFTGVGQDVHMVSCGADKSIYFRTAEKTPDGLSFLRTHHVVEKTTLYDMDLDASQTQTAIACQDRNIRVYDVKSGKMQKCFKGSMSDEGTILKVQLDPSGMYLATSCSDKNICIFDYESGDCVATLFGHSEIVTCMRFSQDCRHLITVSGDSCVFLWRLDPKMTNLMRKKLAGGKQKAGLKVSANIPRAQHVIRRETFITVPLSKLPQIEDEEKSKTPARFDLTHDISVEDPMIPQTNGKMPMWARKMGLAEANTVSIDEPKPDSQQPRGRWAEQVDHQAIRSLLESRSLQLPLSQSPRRSFEGEDEEDDPYFHPQSLDGLLGEEKENDVLEEEEKEEEEGSDAPYGSSLQRVNFRPDSEELFTPGLNYPEMSEFTLYPTNSTSMTAAEDGEFDVKALEVQPQDSEDELSPDSACCLGSTMSQDLPQDDTDSLSQVSSTGSYGVEEDEKETISLLQQHFDTLPNNMASEERFDTDPQSLQPSKEGYFLNPRLSISTRFLSHFQNRVRVIINNSSGSSLKNLVSPVTISQSHLEGEPPSWTCGQNYTSTCANLSQVNCMSKGLDAFPTDQQGSELMEVSIIQSVVDQDLKEILQPPEHHQCVSTSLLLGAEQPGAPTPAPGRQSTRTPLPLDLAAPELPLLPWVLPPSPTTRPHPVHSTRHSAILTTTKRSSQDLKGQMFTCSTAESVASRGNACPVLFTGPVLSTGPVLPPCCSPTRGPTPRAPEREDETEIPSKLQQQLSSTAFIHPGSRVTPTCSVEHLNSTPGSFAEPINLQMCSQVVNELRQTVKRAVNIYRKVSLMADGLEQHSQMASLLKEAFTEVQRELDSMNPTEGIDSAFKPGQPLVDESPGRQLREERTVALLEKYSEMLLRIAEKKMDGN
ncbi:WD repeat-containing protein 62 [Aplochiton taeniatus]